MNIEDVKKAGEQTFNELKVSLETLLVNAEATVMQVGMNYVSKAKQRFIEIMNVVLSAEFTPKDAVQYFLNRMEDEKEILRGMFYYLTAVAKSDIETLANNVQSILLSAATNFLNTVTI